MRPADIAHKAEPTLPAKERRDAKSIPDDPRPTPTPVQESSGEAPARAVSPDKGSGRPGHARGVPSPRTRSATVSFAPVSSTQLSPITLRLARRNLARDNRPSLVVNFAYEEARRTDSNARMMPVRIRPVAGTTRPLIRDNALGIGPPPYRDQ
jgi:hypothetical protein